MIDLKFVSSVPNDIVLGPLIVKNHINNTNEIIIQDSKNILYLINNRGQVEWTREIDGKIIKEVNQIDSYKNGKLQYVFATEKSLNLLDRKGRDVGKFPLKFKDKITYIVVDSPPAGIQDISLDDDILVRNKKIYRQ